jgi:hypothetical protein
MPLTAKLVGNYRKKVTGTLVFRYSVSGTTEEIEQYKEAIGDNLVLDDNTGKPLYFTTRYVADNIKLLITSEGKVATDDTEIAKLQSLVETYGVDVARLMMLSKKASAED